MGRWWRARDPSTRAGLIGLGLAFLWIAIYRAPAFITGDRPLTIGEVDGDLAGAFLVFLIGLWAWSVLYLGNQVGWKRQVVFSRFISIAAAWVAAEALGDILDTLLTAIRRGIAAAGSLALRAVRRGLKARRS